jgi:glycosyltransferase involved in cell wall biosynthesis/GT2 family glycosyltransferase
MNENASYAFEFAPRPNWNWLPAGRTTLRGWFVPKECGQVFDLRVVVSGRLYPARHGLISREAAARWPALPRAFYAGCEFEFSTGPGDSVLQFEFLNHEFRWVEFWRRRIQVNPFTLAARPQARLNLACLPALLQRQMQESLGAVHFDSPYSLTEMIRQACFAAHDWAPAPPLHAALDKPEAVALARYHGVQVCGWAFHETLRIKRLYGTAGVGDFFPVHHGLPQEGVARHFANFPNSTNTMLLGIFPLSPRQSNPGQVNVYAELEDGSHHLILSRRFWHTALTDAEQRMPDGRTSTFLPAVEALHHHIEAAGVNPGGWKAFLSAAWKSRAQLHDWFSTQTTPHAWESLAPHDRQRRRQTPSPRLLKHLVELEGARSEETPGIGLIARANASDVAGLGRLAASLTRQVLRKWELVIVPADDRARRAAAHFAKQDTRIRLAATADAVDAAGELDADYVALIDPGAELTPDALFLCLEGAVGDNLPALIYTDEEIVDSSGAVMPWAWPDWSPALALSGALGGGLALLHRATLEKAGGLQAAAGPALALDAMLRTTAGVSADRVSHVAAYAIRRPARPLTPAATAATIAAVNTALKSRGLSAEAFVPAFPALAGHCLVQVHWSPDYLARQHVTIVIPTRDRLDLLQRCIQRLEQTVNWEHVRLVIVDDGSREPKAVRYLAQLEARTDLPVRVLRAGDPLRPFNYSRLVNAGTAAVETPLVLHFNNDVDALEPGWLEDMAGWFGLADTGAVGAKLVYADGRLNHCGIVISATEALPFTPFEGLPETLPEYPQLHRLARDVSAVIGACLLTRTDLYRQFGGFNEEQFGVAYNDVDYCLRLRAAGWRVLYTPQARLVHWGSESRGRSFHESEHLAFLRTHGNYLDSCFSPHLRLAGRTVAPDLEQPANPHRTGPLRLLVATHNLGLEGAPLFLFEFVEHAIKVDGFTVELIAFADGPLRAAYEALGVRITLVDRHPIHASRTPAEYAARVAAVKETLDLSRIDLVVTNTVVGFWVIELARQAGLPTLWFIHESVRVPRFFEHELPAGMQPVVHDAFRRATRVVFLCEATRRYYDEFNERDHFRILPGWVNTERIREFKAGHTRDALRRRHGIAESESVILNVGTICERKGQHYFLAAARRLAALHKGPVRFLMVGGLGDLYHDLFSAELAAADFPQARIIAKTDAVYDYYALADLAVCTSFEESFPRVLLEAMAFELPVVSTSVHGVPEIIADRAEGLLVAPGDVESLARTMYDALLQSRTPNSLAPMALSKVLRRFDRRRLIPRHIALAREAALG